MNKAEYKAYQSRVADFFESEGIDCLSTDGEPEFSWRDCDCCGATLGGDRYNATGYSLQENMVREGYEICKDCMYYAEYGQLDDMTMLEIDDND